MDIVNNNANEKDAYCDASLSVDDSLALMATLMGHHNTLHKIVKKKLGHAQSATQKQLDKISSSDDQKSVQGNSAEKYERLLKDLASLIEYLSHSGSSTEEIEQIGSAIEEIPKAVKGIYDVLVSMDKELVELIDEISSEDYQNAYIRAQEITTKIQSGKDLLSGIDARSEFKDTRTNMPKIVQEETPAKKDDMDMGYVVLPSGKKVRVL